jgi:hypothetical protein
MLVQIKLLRLESNVKLSLYFKTIATKQRGISVDLGSNKFKKWIFIFIFLWIYILYYYFTRINTTKGKSILAAETKQSVVYFL